MKDAPCQAFCLSFFISLSNHLIHLLLLLNLGALARGSRSNQIAGPRSTGPGGHRCLPIAGTTLTPSHSRQSVIQANLSISVLANPGCSVFSRLAFNFSQAACVACFKTLHPSSVGFFSALVSWKTYHLLAPGQPIVPSWSGRGQNTCCFPSCLSRKHCTPQITKPSSGLRPPHHAPQEPGEGTANSRDLLQLYFITPVPD